MDLKSQCTKQNRLLQKCLFGGRGNTSQLKALLWENHIRYLTFGPKYRNLLVAMETKIHILCKRQKYSQKLKIVSWHSESWGYFLLFDISYVTVCITTGREFFIKYGLSSLLLWQFLHFTKCVAMATKISKYTHLDILLIYNKFQLICFKTVRFMIIQMFPHFKYLIFHASALS